MRRPSAPTMAATISVKVTAWPRLRRVRALSRSGSCPVGWRRSSSSPAAGRGSVGREGLRVWLTMCYLNAGEVVGVELRHFGAASGSIGPPVRPAWVLLDQPGRPAAEGRDAEGVDEPVRVLVDQPIAAELHAAVQAPEHGVRPAPGAPHVD